MQIGMAQRHAAFFSSKLCKGNIPAQTLAARTPVWDDQRAKEQGVVAAVRDVRLQSRLAG